MSTRKMRRQAIEIARREWMKPCIVCEENTLNTHGVCTPCLHRDRDDAAFAWALPRCVDCGGDCFVGHDHCPACEAAELLQPILAEEDDWQEPMYQYDAWFLAAFHELEV